jgi:LmbE family N-acetylglucosaminyl deacetylase
MQLPQLRRPPRRTAAVALLVATLLLCVARLTAASERGSAASLLRSAPPRPQLAAPAAPSPREIRLPSARNLLLAKAKKELHVPPHIRLMVFAPHPDDETLGAGGLIQRVLASGGKVQVVFVTNGDGYVDGVRVESHHAKTQARDFIEYGERRHDEAVRAAADIGLNPSDTVFLGFPDDGIDDLWAAHWSERKPYVSPYTRFDRPPYKESLSRRVEYAGSDLEDEITRTLRAFRPNWVVLPDPRDRHPDHCTTGVFVLDALRTLRREPDGWFDRTQAFAYLVHYPDYPASAAWIREIEGAGVGGSLTAGRVLTAAPWLTLPLTPAELVVKQRAVAAYETQVQVMKPFLTQFLRGSELFAQLGATQIATVPREYAARFRRPQ